MEGWPTAAHSDHHRLKYDAAMSAACLLLEPAPQPLANMGKNLWLVPKLAHEAHNR